MACKESICRNCFHSYVCERFNENKDDNNEKCHFANDHYIPRDEVAPKSEVAREIFELIDCAFSPVLVYNGYTVKEYLAELKKKYTEGNNG